MKAAPTEYFLDLSQRAINSESRDVREDAVCKIAGITGDLYAALGRLERVVVAWGIEVENSPFTGRTGIQRAMVDTVAAARAALAAARGETA